MKNADVAGRKNDKEEEEEVVMFSWWLCDEDVRFSGVRE